MVGSGGDNVPKDKKSRKWYSYHSSNTCCSLSSRYKTSIVTLPSNSVIELFSLSLSCVCVCVCEGLGRAPLLVTIALIENGMDNLSAVNYVRERRRDAFNKQQLNFLVHYKPIRKNCHCLVMWLALPSHENSIKLNVSHSLNIEQTHETDSSLRIDSFPRDFESEEEEEEEKSWQVFFWKEALRFKFSVIQALIIQTHFPQCLLFQRCFHFLIKLQKVGKNRIGPW